MNDKVKIEKITDIFDNIESYIAEMRETKDSELIPAWINDHTWRYFRETNPGKEELKQMAIFMADHTYRYAAFVNHCDSYTRTYFAVVMSYVWDKLQDRGADMFYLLDNVIRDDRFCLAVEFFELSGMAVVTPHTIRGEYLKYQTIKDRAERLLSVFEYDASNYSQNYTKGQNLPWEDIEQQITRYMSALRNIVYIEKDDSVNYLDEVIQMAKRSNYISILRNESPNKSLVIEIN